jgi:hypothetical protein
MVVHGQHVAAASGRAEILVMLEGSQLVFSLVYNNMPVFIEVEAGAGSAMVVLVVMRS